MKKILHINSHPDFENEEHLTNSLDKFGLNLLKAKTGVEVMQINLYDCKTIIPQINPQMYSAWRKHQLELTDEEKSILEIQNQLINQWIDVDYIFIYSPLHNFNVTAKFKDYADNLLIAGKTFKDTESGSVGLLDKNKKVIYIQSSGADYNIDLRYINADIAPHYVRTVLSFMGIEKMDLIRAEGLNMSAFNKTEIAANAMSQLESTLQYFL